VYHYDGAGRLVKVQNRNDDVLAKYSYDGYSRLVKTIEGSPANQCTTYRIPMGDETAYETIIEVSKTTKHKYISGNGWYLARVEKVNGGAEQVSYYHTDHLGSIRAVSNAEASQMTYDAFGKLLDSTGAAQDHDYRFTGKPSDSTGLSYYGARFYDPELGRFINQDPARDGSNWYVYCASNH
jgi:RHS repeat-associated protein